MIEHLEAIRDYLATLGYETHLVWAVGPATGQYLVLGTRGRDRPTEMPLCGGSASLETDVRVTAVTGNPAGAELMLDRVRQRLSPQLRPGRVPMAGRDVRVRFERSEYLDVDTDTVITATGQHPAVGVDTYRLTSEPLD